MKRWLMRIPIALGVTIVLLLVYGAAVEPRFVLDEERWRVALPKLGEEWAGTDIAVMSDLQIGMWWSNEGMVEKAVGEIVEDEPDAVLLGGDFLYSKEPDVSTQVDRVVKLLDPLVAADIPTYAVLGNHDYVVGAADELTTALEDAGIRVLRNTALPVSSPTADADPLYVVGIGPQTPHVPDVSGRADVDAALADVPDDAPRVVLTHDPTTFDELPAGTAPLTLAGHTHCGQIALPGTPRWSYLALTDEEKIVADGWAPAQYGAEGNRMFVTCGIGFSTVPLRINAPPQVAFFELVPKEGGR
ncbi:metallophosphoesterase [Blastococcus sp. KM273128]|uniref:metallophosphoesterase n=1 Tax=Blastococcus sp. KM273128 TaxID=2570314 RepID=UPI001F454907|nr:metallophosphoesterase [Blastococcus sp. KM273128]MCF6746322.1 metallophosphoesterase [Blastococcus sp. KM273128]